MTQPKVDNKWVERKKKFMKILNKGRSGDLDHYGCAEYNPEEAEEAWQLVTQTQQDTLEELLKDAKRELRKSEEADLVCYWMSVIEWISQTIKQRREEV